MKKKGVKAVFLGAVIALSLFLGIGYASPALAADPWKISDNDLSETTGEVGKAIVTYADEWVCPTNHNYYVNTMYRLDEDYNEHLATDEEREAYRAQVEAKNPVNGTDYTLSQYAGWYNGIYAISYLSREVTVVDGSAKTTLPANFGLNELDTVYFLSGRTPSGEFVHLFDLNIDAERLASDFTFSWSDYLSDEYVYYVLFSAEHDTDANASVKRFFVTEEKLDDMRAMIPAAEISDVKPSVIKEGPTGSMYRMYNPNSGEHFYTANVGEAQNLVDAGWKDEGIGWFAPGESSTPVYRLYNENAGDHHYTIDSNERNNLISAGWKDEGIGWYSDDDKDVPIYREYNPNAVTGTHNYTNDKEEHDNLAAAGWSDEGIGWYGISDIRAITDPAKYEEAKAEISAIDLTALTWAKDPLWTITGTEAERNEANKASLEGAVKAAVSSQDSSAGSAAATTVNLNLNGWKKGYEITATANDTVDIAQGATNVVNLTISKAGYSRDFVVSCTNSAKSALSFANLQPMTADSSEDFGLGVYITGLKSGISEGTPANAQEAQAMGYMVSATKKTGTGDVIVKDILGMMDNTLAVIIDKESVSAGDVIEIKLSHTLTGASGVTTITFTS